MITVNTVKTTAVNAIFPKRKKNAKRAAGQTMNYETLAAALIPFD